MPENFDRVERVVRDALRVAVPDIGIVDGSTHLASELGLDSAQVMDLIMEIEDKFEIDIPINLVSDMTTVADLVAVVDRQLKAREAR